MGSLNRRLGAAAVALSMTSLVLTAIEYYVFWWDLERFEGGPIASALTRVPGLGSILALAAIALGFSVRRSGRLPLFAVWTGLLLLAAQVALIALSF